MNVITICFGIRDISHPDLQSALTLQQKIINTGIKWVTEPPINCDLRNIHLFDIFWNFHSCIFHLISFKPLGISHLTLKKRPSDVLQSTADNLVNI